jgi:hypothetical protein
MQGGSKDRSWHTMLHIWRLKGGDVEQQLVDDVMAARDHFSRE